MAIKMKAGDTAPHVNAILLDALGDPVNIAGATIRFILATRDENRTVIVDATAANMQNGTGSDGSKGAVRYEWAEGDTDTPGRYDAEFEVVYEDGDRQTFPTEGYVDTTIVQDLGGTG